MKTKITTKFKKFLIILGGIFLILLFSGSAYGQKKIVNPSIKYMDCRNLNSYFDRASIEQKKELLIILLSGQYSLDISISESLFIPDSVIEISTTIEDVVDILLNPDEIALFEVVETDKIKEDNLDEYWSLGRELQLTEQEKAITSKLKDPSIYLRSNTRYSCEYYPKRALKISSKKKILYILISECDKTWNILYNDKYIFKNIYPDEFQVFIK